MATKKKSNRKQTDKKHITKQLAVGEGEEQETTQNGPVSFPIVGIGASAGGLAAFEAFFSGMPADRDPNMAFVLVQHLAPDHKSILSDLIRRYTRMDVFDVEDGMRLKPNCAYIIPPNRDMALLRGALQLLTPLNPRGQRQPIDFFFRSLALDQRERAICIILSGTGSDGTLGMRAIKSGGGMAMVQTPDSTEFDGMPRSAIDTGLADYELKPDEMVTQLITYVEHIIDKRSPLSQIPTAKAGNALKKIFILLRNATGHDFSGYKPNTIIRRIERRMAVHQIETIDNYILYLQQTVSEVESLFRDLLIGVTNFFRDPEAFHLLKEQVIRGLFADKSDGTVVRVWSVGCSTGEEAYSLAILIQEHIESLQQKYTVQVFATDIDSQAIATARAGLYPASIATDLTPERLSRFFTAEPDSSGYRIHKNIRDMLVFSEQDVIKDPPFSKLDLLSCRNLLIYLNGDLQKKLISLFHYALNPGGILFLGTSETIGDSDRLFSIIDRKSKLYKRKGTLKGDLRSLPRTFLSPMTNTNGALLQTDEKIADVTPLPLSDLTERTILQQVTPVAVLVNKKGDIVYLHGRTGMYLELSPGDVGTNILKMAREGLNPSLTSALQKASVNNKIVRHFGLRVKTNGGFTAVNMTVHPVSPESITPPQAPLYLVTFEESSGFGPERMQLDMVSRGTEIVDDSVTPERDVKRLRQELRIKEEYLQSAIEELDTSNEELKSSNEEMQSVNEELQSTNEELETSKEELQSINEELATVNTELQAKVAALSQANNDMNNLLAGTGIATIFVDLRQRILRFTPFTTHIINLIKSDLGRPVGDIAPNIKDYNQLTQDIQTVLDTLVPIDIDVQTAVENKWYRMRIQSYRTIDNVIEGAVITFIDITETKKAEEALAQANALSRLAVVVRDTRDGMTVQNLEGDIQAWNPSAEKMYGWSEAEALTMNIRDLIPKELQEEALAKVQQLSEAEILAPFTTQRICKNGKIISINMISTALVDTTGKFFAISTTERIAGKEEDSGKGDGNGGQK